MVAVEATAAGAAVTVVEATAGGAAVTAVGVTRIIAVAAVALASTSVRATATTTTATPRASARGFIVAPFGREAPTGGAGIGTAWTRILAGRLTTRSSAYRQKSNKN